MCNDSILKACTLFYKKISNLCDPLKTHFNINHFYFHRVKNDGTLLLIGNNLQWLEYYVDEDLHLKNVYYGHPDNFEEGVYYHRYCADSGFQDIISCGRKYHNMNPHIQIMHKTEEGFDSYGFATTNSSHEMDALIFQELPLLKLFYQRFREEFEFVLNRAEEYQVDIAHIVGKKFYENKNTLYPRAVNRKNFLKDISSEFASLSKQESLVYKYLVIGLPAREISLKMSISVRTVEHYIENIKNKLNCSCKHELLQKYHKFNLVNHL